VVKQKGGETLPLTLGSNPMNEIKPHAEPMYPQELEKIGIELFGEWGWPIKIGKLIGKDATTVRRWRQTDNEIRPKYAIKIREYYDQHKNNENIIQKTDNSEKLSKIISQLNEIPGCVFEISKTNDGEFIEIKAKVPA
jgi:hypothetical protein